MCPNNRNQLTLFMKRIPPYTSTTLVLCINVLTILNSGCAADKPQDNANESPFYAFPTKTLVLANEQFNRRDEPSLVSLNDGTFLLAYANHEGTSDNDTSDIAGIRLDKNGDQVGDEWILVESPPNGINAMSPALRRLKDGRLGMAYSYRLSLKVARREFRYSEDEGITWSDPVVVAEGEYKTGRHDSLLVLENGTLLAPCHCTDDWDKHYLHVRVSRSTDGGRTWKLGEQKIETPYAVWPEGSSYHGVRFESGCIEPFAVQRADGSILMTLRTGLGTQFFSESFDEGVTWTQPKSLGIVSPVAPANLTNIPGTDDLLLVWTSSFNITQRLLGLRHEISTAISKDGGKTWPYEYRKVLINDQVNSNDYPFVKYIGNDAWVIYRSNPGKIMLARNTSTKLMKVPVSWLYEPEK
jgi:sialidase-1